ncbi:hypothetical protein PHA8399_03828 [Leisingera aquaemixtae]|uniref:Uncharacterized protein n=1 Tax=Leisingera aquaemixtae TaxID=1396826 RepID=A0A0N7M579_9RHOB|nr:hypothetical protein PHA8399_03828 [Leisingera aquaemixtae]
MRHQMRIALVQQAVGVEHGDNNAIGAVDELAARNADVVVLLAGVEIRLAFIQALDVDAADAVVVEHRIQHLAVLEAARGIQPVAGVAFKEAVRHQHPLRRVAVRGGGGLDAVAQRFAEMAAGHLGVIAADDADLVEAALERALVQREAVAVQHVDMHRDIAGKRAVLDSDPIAFDHQDALGVVIGTRHRLGAAVAGFRRVHHVEGDIVHRHPVGQEEQRRGVGGRCGAHIQARALLGGEGEILRQPQVRPRDLVGVLKNQRVAGLEFLARQQRRERAGDILTRGPAEVRRMPNGHVISFHWQSAAEWCGRHSYIPKQC